MFQNRFISLVLASVLCSLKAVYTITCFWIYMFFFGNLWLCWERQAIGQPSDLLFFSFLLSCFHPINISAVEFCSTKKLTRIYGFNLRF